MNIRDSKTEQHFHDSIINLPNETITSVSVIWWEKIGVTDVVGGETKLPPDDPFEDLDGAYMKSKYARGTQTKPYKIWIFLLEIRCEEWQWFQFATTAKCLQFKTRVNITGEL